MFNKDFGMVLVVDMANNLFAMLLPKTTLFRDQLPLFSVHFMQRNNEYLYIVLEKLLQYVARITVEHKLGFNYVCSGKCYKLA